MKRLTAVLAAVLVLAGSALATNTFWDGSSDADGDGVNWTDPDNWNTGAVPTGSDHAAIGDGSPGISPATATIDGAAASSSAGLIGGWYSTGQTGTVNMVNGASWNMGSYLYLANTNNSNGTLNINDSSATATGLYMGHGQNGQGTIDVTDGSFTLTGGRNWSAYGTGGIATINLDNSTFDSSATDVQLATGQDSVMNIDLVDSTWHSSSNIIVGDDNTATGKAVISIDGGSQFNVDGQIQFRGGDGGGMMTYAPVLAATPTDGKMHLGGLFAVATGNNNKVTLNVDVDNGCDADLGSTTQYTYVALGSNSEGVLNVDGVTTGFGGAYMGYGTNSEATFNLSDATFSIASGGRNWLGDGQDSTTTINLSNATYASSASDEHLAQGPGALATINLIDSTWHSTSNIILGDDNTASGKAVIDIDADSQFNVDGQIQFRGGDGGGMMTYAPVLAATPTDGKMHLGGLFAVATGNNNKVTLDVDVDNGCDADLGTTTQYTYVALGSNSEGVLNVDGVTTGFGGAYMGYGTNSEATFNLSDATFSIASGGRNWLGDGQDSTTTINLSNATYASSASDEHLAQGPGALATINLVDSTWHSTSNIILGDDNTASGKAVIDIDADSQFNVDGQIQFRGGDGGGMMTYAPVLAATPTDGKMHLGGLFAVATGNNNKVTLNVDVDNGCDADLGSTTQYTYVASGSNSEGVLNVDGVATGFGGAYMGYGTNSEATFNLSDATFSIASGGRNWLGDGQDSTTTINLSNATYASSASDEHLAQGPGALATINLVDSTWHSTSNIILGDDNTASGKAVIDIDADSQFNVDGQIQFRGGDGGGMMTYAPVLAATPTDGKMHLGGLFSVATGNNNKVTLDVDVDNGCDADLGTTTQYLSVATGASSEGVVNLDGVTTGFGGIYVGYGTNSQGTLNLTDATLSIASGGRFWLGAGTNGFATINLDNGTVDVGSDADMRYGSNGIVVLQGTGALDVGGQLRANGRIIADGGDLDVTYGSLGNTDGSGWETQGDGSATGWYAVNAGRMTLQDLAIDGSDITWGDVVTDTSPDMVNSIRFANWSGSDLDGSLGISVLHQDHAAAESTPFGVVGLWDVAATGLAFDGVDMTFRYDDALAATLGVNESDLRVFGYSGGTWNDVTVGAVDTGNKLISASSGGFEQLAVGTVPILTWDKGADGDWTETEWDPRTFTPNVPDASIHAKVVTDDVVTVSTDEEAFQLTVTDGEVTVNAGASLGLGKAAIGSAGTLTVNGDLTAGSVATDGTVNVGGTADVTSLNVTGGATTITGTVSAGDDVQISAGSLDVTGTGDLTTAALTVTGGTVNASGTVDATTMDVSDGTANLTGTADVGTMSLTGGTVNAGDGVTVGSLEIAGGTLGTGSEDVTITGDMTTDASYTQTGGGYFKVGGAAITEEAGLDRLTLGGGTLTISGGSGTGARITGLGASASSYYGSRYPWDCINEVGMYTDLEPDGNLDYHDNNPENMWHTDNAITGQWLKVDLGAVYDVGNLKVWNYNEHSGNPNFFTRRGVEDAIIWYSDAATDPGTPGGAGWSSLGTYTFTKSPDGAPNPLTVTDIFDLGGISARWVAFALQSNHGADLYTGFSELQFYEAVATMPDFSGTDLIVEDDTTLVLDTTDAVAFDNLFIDVEATLDIAGGPASMSFDELTITYSGPLAAGDHTLATYDTGLLGEFSFVTFDLPAGWSYTLNDYADTDALIVTLTQIASGAIPEPGCLALLALGLGTLLVARRRS